MSADQLVRRAVANVHLAFAQAGPNFSSSSAIAWVTLELYADCVAKVSRSNAVTAGLPMFDEMMVWISYTII